MLFVILVVVVVVVVATVVLLLLISNIGSDVDGKNDIGAETVDDNDDGDGCCWSDGRWSDLAMSSNCCCNASLVCNGNGVNGRVGNVLAVVDVGVVGNGVGVIGVDELLMVLALPN